MNIAVNRSFQKDVRRVKDSESLARLQDLMSQARRARDVRELRQIKKIKGEDNFYRIRVGDFRVGLVVEGDTVTFVRFLHRRDIYRRFP